MTCNCHDNGVEPGRYVLVSYEALVVVFVFAAGFVTYHLLTRMG